ncbi:NTE family protein RssA [Sterolibacterium denitrificans]|uniref:NTE family protein RssA n=1 Tax=Sterolibacterium denitrificans TaxID=157592 RepID=A0A7Z7HPI0_9PROT|nr:patatin-like phospholipase RssA [Sterolibacterium denitrificans]SMB22781.1 NTE family protein RssA [Sterolibacterium denitrificans]
MTNKSQVRSGRRRRKLGIALGGGSARGWAHIGVLRALEELGVRPDLVCGTSIGALVGAAYAVGELDRLEDWVRGMGVGDVLRFLDFRLSAGLLKGERLTQYLRDNFSDLPIEDMPMPFAAVATALSTGAEIWLREGSTMDAVRASIALPGIFTPIMSEGRVLVDGGLVNPVPVSLARAMGADVVIAVDLNSDVLGRYLNVNGPAADEADEIQDAMAATMATEAIEDEPSDNDDAGFVRRLKSGLDNLLAERAASKSEMPSMFSVLASSLNIMQVRISRSRMAGDPPDALITPRLGHMSLYDFHRGAEAIEEGRRAAIAALPQFVPLGLTHQPAD